MKFVPSGFRSRQTPVIVVETSCLLPLSNCDKRSFLYCRLRSRTFVASFFCGLVLAGLLSGCGSSAQPASLRGTVKFAGVPVGKGSVRLSTEDGTAGPGGVSPIVDGSFDIDSGRGLKAGKYLVIIHGFKETGRTVQVDDASPPRKEELLFIPRQYNDDSRQTIELKPGKNKNDFELTR
jgi:hypothetical protein